MTAIELIYTRLKLYIELDDTLTDEQKADDIAMYEHIMEVSK